MLYRYFGTIKYHVEFVKCSYSSKGEFRTDLDISNYDVLINIAKFNLFEKLDKYSKSISFDSCDIWYVVPEDYPETTLVL